MTRRPHPYDGDIGGVRASRRRAVTDLTAVEPPGPGGDHRKPRGCWPLLLVLAAGPARILAGWLFGAVS